jgi:hypothetical protein
MREDTEQQPSPTQQTQPKGIDPKTDGLCIM